MRAPRIISMKDYNSEEQMEYAKGVYGYNIAFAGFRNPKTGLYKKKGFVVTWETGNGNTGAKGFKTKTEARNWLNSEMRK